MSRDDELDRLADRCMRLTAEKERLIYWLIRVLDVDRLVDPDIWRGAEATLRLLGYPLDGERAELMLELGEPGTFLKKED
jgi:hypothetical protein